MNQYHLPVLLKETLWYLSVKPDRKYIDCTLGGGGHTKAILEAGGIVLGIDQDKEAIEHNKKEIGQWIKDNRLILRQGNFAHLKEIANNAGFEKVSGVLFDLGISSHQLEQSGRGFSFQNSEPLDMRMDQDGEAVTAADLINAGAETELAGLFRKFGQESYASQIARKILTEREKGKIETTGQLVRIIGIVKGREKGRIHPATKIFQALRIAVNDELEALEAALPQTLEVLQMYGRVIVISFHSLEDKTVKRFFKENSNYLRAITPKPIQPSAQEVTANPRSRSAKLRAAEKIIN